MNPSSGGWIIAAAAAAFAVDLLTPLGYAVPMLYVLPILLTWMLPSQQSTVLVVGGVLLLTWIGVPLSPGELTPEALTNRAMGSALLLAIGWLLLIHKASAQKMTAVQQARDASEERFAKAFRTSPHPIGITEVATGCCIEVNDACLQLFGFRREEVIGHTTLMLGIWPNPEDRCRLIERVKAGEPVRNLELTFRTKSGDLRHILVSSDLLELSGTLCLITVGNDITARKRAEETLRQLNETLEQRVAERTATLYESEARLRAFLENSATIAWLKDEDGRHVFLSPTYEKRFGVRLSEWKGKTDFEVWPKRIAEEFRRTDLTVMADGRTREMVEQTIAPDGMVSWWLNHKFMFRDSSGKRYVGGLGVDITQHKRYEQLLQSSEAFTREVLDSLSAHVCVLSHDGVIIRTNESWNQFAQANSDPPQTVGAMGDNYLDVCRRAIADGDTTALPILSGIEAVLAGKQKVFSAEYPCHSPDEKRWFLLRVSPLMESQGVVLSHLDISDRKRAEETLLVKQRELERSQAKLEELAAKLLMAQEIERRRLACELHDDVTQRIAAVAVDLQGIRQITRGDEASVVARVHQAGKMAEQITTDLQRLAYQLHPSLLEHVGLEAAVQEYVEEFQTRTGLKTKVKVRNLLPALSLERATCLYRVLQESLQNVRKHASATTVMVRLLGTRRGVGLCIHDDGRGFDHPSMSAGKLKGLGLISMEERVGAMQGAFRIKTKPGDGTEVHAWVPLAERAVSTNGGAGR